VGVLCELHGKLEGGSTEKVHLAMFNEVEKFLIHELFGITQMVPVKQCHVLSIPHRIILIL
jgi:hypothetical protein